MINLVVTIIWKEAVAFSEQLYQYQDLSDEAQVNARRTFINFYIHQLRDDNLEIIDQYADDKDMAMINHLLEENSYLTIDKLSELAEKELSRSFDKILSDLKMEYNNNGQNQTNWDEWDNDIHATLPKED